MGRTDPGEVILALGIFGGIGAVVAAYITHLIWIVKILMFSSGSIPIGHAILAVIGLIFPPLGVIHGFVIWFT